MYSSSNNPTFYLLIFLYTSILLLSYNKKPSGYISVSEGFFKHTYTCSGIGGSSSPFTNQLRFTVGILVLQVEGRYALSINMIFEFCLNIIFFARQEVVIIIYV